MMPQREKKTLWREVSNLDCRWGRRGAYSGECLNRYTGHVGDAIDFAYLDDEQLISIGLDATVCLWQAPFPEPRIGTDRS